MKYCEETKKEDLKKLETEISSEEVSLIMGNIIRLKMQGKTLEEMTYDEILDNGKLWQDEYKLEHSQEI